MWNKISKIYVGTNLVRPVPEPTPFIPWANTKAYYKLNWNLDDSSGNNFNVLSQTWTITYPNNKYASMTNFRAVFPTPYSRRWTTDPFTISLWGRNLSNENVFSYWLDYNNEGYWWLVLSSSNSWWSASCVVSPWVGGWTDTFTVSSNVWHNAIVTRGYSEWMKLYIDWVFKGWMIGGTRDTGDLRINNRAWIWTLNETGASTISWDLSEIIVENKVRTAQEIADYYNASKSIYWL